MELHETTTFALEPEERAPATPDRELLELEEALEFEEELELEEEELPVG